MLWYPNKNKLIITPPHTASGNLTRAATEQHSTARARTTSAE